MKKYFSVLLVLLLGFVLVACNGDTGGDGDGNGDPVRTKPTITGVAAVNIDLGGTFDPLAGVTAKDADGKDLTAEIVVGGDTVDTDTVGTYTVTYTVEDSEGLVGTASRQVKVVDPDTGGNGEPPTEIVIMHGAVDEVDPRLESFSGRDRGARLALHDQVEKDLNVRIVYKPYPADAPWGPARQEAIISWHAAGAPKADIYWLTTIWLKEIADNNAIVPLNQWLNLYGEADETAKIVSSYQGQIWGTSPEPFRGELGLFINTALLAEIGIDDPVDLWNDGEWTFTRFKTWVAEAQQALGPNQYAMGGAVSLYAESMIPLNGGRLIDDVIQMVTFNNPAAHEVYDLLQELYNLGAVEAGGSYDTGSEAWQSGNVLLHPGSLWFLNATNRWADLGFVKNGDVGVIPFPMPDGASKDDYVQPLAGQAIYTVSRNAANPAKEELAFEVWNAVQLWDDQAMLDIAFQNRLEGMFDDQRHIDIMMEISQNVFLDINEQLGIGAFGATAWQVNVNSGIAQGSVRSRLEEIVPVYQAALDEYLGK